MTELKYEIISTSSCLMIMIINLQQDPLDIKVKHMDDFSRILPI
jgi:hypothetical protein